MDSRHTVMELDSKIINKDQRLKLTTDHEKQEHFVTLLVVSAWT